jgi:hypothetical protein
VRSCSPLTCPCAQRYGIEKGTLSDTELASVVGSLGLKDAAAAAACAQAVWALEAEVIRGSHASAEEMAGQLLAGRVAAGVVGPLARVCWELHGQWKGEAARTQLSLPRLRALDWRVDVKTASGGAAGVGVPSVIVQLSVEPDQVVTFEMDKETLQALLSGLGKIRSQLAGLN